MRVVVSALLILVALLTCSESAWCYDEDQGFKTFGIRGGFSATSRKEDFQQYEVYTRYGLPWSIRGDSGWGLAMQLNGAIGALHAAGETGVIAAIGPGIIVDKAGGKGFAFDLGGDLNGLSRDHFGRVNLNGKLLFDGHVGIMYRFASGFGIGYRFQHMSNGGTTSHINTGLDLHMAELSWNLH